MLFCLNYFLFNLGTEEGTHKLCHCVNFGFRVLISIQSKTRQKTRDFFEKTLDIILIGKVYSVEMASTLKK